ncbi:MAG TPA: threonine synthase [Firmicutes bacterium]|nr:threonine synthase [Bacillota bacterium]
MYISTRGGVAPVTASKAIYQGLAPDGGLFVPETVPSVSKDFVAKLADLSYRDLAKEIFSLYLDDFTKEEIYKVVTSAYGDNFDDREIAPLHGLDCSRYILELWHGPTAAFKDMALQALPYLLTTSMAKQEPDKEVVILVATSGDTGKAALEGFSDVDKTRIIVFYPNGGVSEVQRLQMVTTTGNNTSVIAVEGNFDDCQNGVKAIFNDGNFAEKLEEKGYRLSSANSINWGRLLPQIVYYFKAYGALVKRGAIQAGETMDVVVPTGNFGNILAAYYGKAMGLPIGKLICASNKNKVLTDVLNTGEYNRNREFFRTVSPSMDILISSNFERFVFEMNGRDSRSVCDLFDALTKNGVYHLDEATAKRMSEIMCGYYVDEEATLETIGKTYQENHYLIDTHTAVAVNALGQYRLAGNGEKVTVIDSTANPYKFNQAVYEAINQSGAADKMNEFEISAALEQQTGVKIHRGLLDLDQKEVLHKKVVEKENMQSAVAEILGV